MLDSYKNIYKYLVCNITPPLGAKPSLLTFRDVETLFHEFGHGLQHMLTKVDEADVSGINGIEWDAVEIPSQFMENWCYHKNTLLGFARHYKDNHNLPDDLYNKFSMSSIYIVIPPFVFEAVMGEPYDQGGEHQARDKPQETEASTGIDKIN